MSEQHLDLFAFPARLLIKLCADQRADDIPGLFEDAPRDFADRLFRTAPALQWAWRAIDPTARRTLKMIKKVGLELNQLVLWNFYASFEAKTKPQRFWEKEAQTLAKIMPNLKVVLAFGNDTWLGMQHVELPKRVVLIGAPHPSNLGVSSNKKLAEDRIEHAWARAMDLVES